MSKLHQKKAIKTAKQIGVGLTTVLLKVIGLLGYAYTGAIMDHYHRGYGSRYEAASRPVIYSTLNRLKRQGLVRVQKKDNKVYYRLTQTGRARVLIRQVFQNKIKPPDGLSTVIIFDIPEEKRRIRTFLRRLLLRHGFINLQKSVMIAPYELPKEFFQLMAELGIRQYVTLLKSKIIYL